MAIIVGAKFFDSQTYEFALFAGLMFLDMGAFIWLAIRYKAVPLEDLDRVDKEDKELEESRKKDPLEFASKDD